MWTKESFEAWGCAVSPHPLAPSPTPHNPPPAGVVGEGEHAVSGSGTSLPEHGCCPPLKPPRMWGSCHCERTAGMPPPVARGQLVAAARSRQTRRGGRLLAAHRSPGAPMHASQRRHAPQPDEPPPTSLPPRAGDQGGTAEGSRGTVRAPRRGACGAVPLGTARRRASGRCNPTPVAC